jgi:hypothetical protein
MAETGETIPARLASLLRESRHRMCRAYQQDRSRREIEKVEEFNVGGESAARRGVAGHSAGADARDTHVTDVARRVGGLPFGVE